MPFRAQIMERKISELTPYRRNARTHSPKQIKQIAASIERFGFTNPVLVSESSEIIAGHGPVASPKLLGLTSVPTLALSHLSEEERKAYVLAENKLALNAGWDREILAIELQALIDLDFDVEATGFSLAEIDFAIDELVNRIRRVLTRRTISCHGKWTAVRTSSAYSNPKRRPRATNAIEEPVLLVPSKLLSAGRWRMPTR